MHQTGCPKSARRGLPAAAHVIWDLALGHALITLSFSFHRGHRGHEGSFPAGALTFEGTAASPQRPCVTKTGRGRGLDLVGT